MTQPTGQLRSLAVTWWLSAKAPGPHKSVIFFNCLLSFRRFTHIVPKPYGEDTVLEVRSFAWIVAVKGAEEVELSTEAGLSTRLTAFLPIRPRTGGLEGGDPSESAQM